ncbi:hypothetical protein GW17_00036442 [Ensete ventricosum]|nr:hypothetical protein GW17_00036442 [Ensete ventricosum]
MHPLRFPNSGIRAKAARRRGSQPRPAPMQGRPPTARAEANDTHKGRQPPAGRSAAPGHNHLQHDTRKGGRLQDTRKGLPPAGAAALAAPWQCCYRWAKAATTCVWAAAAAQRGQEG